MNKLLLSLAAAAFLAGTATAQTKLTPELERQLVSTLNGKAKAAKLNGAAERVIGKSILRNSTAAKLDDSEEEARPSTWLSYMTDGTEGLTLLPITTFTNAGGSINLMPLQFFGSEMLQRYVGNSVGEVYFYLGPSVYSNATAYLITDQGIQESFQFEDSDVHPYNPSEDNINATIANFTYTITGKESFIAIGLDADISKNSAYSSATGDYLYLVALNNQSGATSDAFYLYGIQNGQFVNYGDYSTGWTSTQTGEEFVMQVAQFAVTEGDATGVKKNDANAIYTGNIRGDVHTGTGANGKLSFYNMGLNPISSIKYKYEANGESKEGSASLESPIAFAGTGTFSYEGILASTPGRSTGKITITGVNGVDDEFDTDGDNEASNEILSLSQGYKRIPVIEEFTSTMCGWCPYGIVGLKKAEETMGDGKIVSIAVHSDYNGNEDELTADSYQTVLNYLGINSYPSVSINRELNGHAYYGTSNDGLWMDAARMYANVGEANMQLTSAFTNGMKNAIKADVTMDFSINAPEDNYAVIYVLTEDGITGYDQLNYFASSDKDKFDDDVKYLCDEKGKKYGTTSDGTVIYTFQPTFDHVARYINDPLATADASYLPAVTAGSQVTHSTTISISTKDLPAAQNFNKANLKVAALLVDVSSGAIITGVQAPVGETSDWSAIESVKTTEGNAAIDVADGAFTVTADNAKAEVYSVDGKLVSSCTVNGTASIPTFGKGVYVIRVVENGSVTTKKATF